MNPHGPCGPGVFETINYSLPPYPSPLQPTLEGLIPRIGGEEGANPLLFTDDMVKPDLQ